VEAVVFDAADLVPVTTILARAVRHLPNSWTRRLSIPPSPSRQADRSSYTKGVRAHWRETRVGEHRELVLEDLPFEPGQTVEVLVISKVAGSTRTSADGLRGSVLEYDRPFEPVASE
jgi:hypothetical protein